MAKITFKEVNVLQYFHTYYVEVYMEVYRQLKDVSDHVFVSYMTSVEDPTEVEFCVGARNPAILHEFIRTHAHILSQLSPKAEKFIKEFYSKPYFGGAND